MTSLSEIRMEPRYTLEQIEAAVLSIPLAHFGAALRFGVSAEDGWKIARAQLADDLRRKLMEIDRSAMRRQAP